MEKKEEKIKSIFSLDQISDRPVSRKGCPTPEDLLKSFAPEAPFEFKERIIDHLIRCPACQQEFELIKNYYNLASQVETKILKKYRDNGFFHRSKDFFFSSGISRKLVTASSILLLLTIFSFLLFFNHQKDLETRGNTVNLSSAGLIEDISPSGETVVKLRWNPIPGASFYRVEIFDQEMAFLWKSGRLTETSLELPENLTDRLKNQKFFFWQLFIYSNDQKLIESQVKKVNWPIQ
ncbi:MAG: hypothetical protein ACP5P6_08535 [Candidatus Saccharicenans sp.]